MTSHPSQAKLEIEGIIEELFDLPRWDEKAGTQAFGDRYIRLLTRLTVLTNERKDQPITRPKVFVARYPDSTHIESDSAVDVILAQVGYGKLEPKLTRESLEPLSQDEFHRFICDTLAAELQAGSVSPMDINNATK